ncbi:MAG: RNA polymerase sigma factor [Gemmatimonadota bacterium]
MTRERDEVLDEWLVLRCQGGDARAVELLARAWHPRLLRRAAILTGRPDAAADVAQEAWLGIVRGLGRLKDPASFRGWAYRCVRSRTRSGSRRER